MTLTKKIETPIEFGSAVKQQIGLKYYVILFNLWGEVMKLTKLWPVTL